MEMTANSTYCEAKLHSDGPGVAEWGKNGKTGGFDKGRAHPFLPGHSLIHAPRSPQFWLRFPVPEAFLTLIQQKPALLFGKSHDSLPVRLSGAISQLEMTANSTYWEANLRSDGTGVAKWER